MSLIRPLATIGFCLVALPALPSAHCPGDVASVTLRLVQGSLILVPVEINNSGPYEFVVDTGAQVSTIDTSLASDLKLQPEGDTGVAGAAIFARQPYTHLDILQIGAHSVTNALAIIQNLAQLKAADPSIRGILGENFLAHFDLLIDNRQHMLCLDESPALVSVLASAVKGEHIPLAEPYGPVDAMPFTRPFVIAARLPELSAKPLLLRLDSGSNAPLLYSSPTLARKAGAAPTALLKRVVNGTEQSFAVLPPQELQLGKQPPLRNLVFVIPVTSIGAGSAPREDGLLPTIALQRVFISYEYRYAILDTW